MQSKGTRARSLAVLVWVSLCVTGCRPNDASVEKGQAVVNSVNLAAVFDKSLPIEYRYMVDVPAGELTRLVECRILFRPDEQRTRGLFALLEAAQCVEAESKSGVLDDLLTDDPRPGRGSALLVQSTPDGVIIANILGSGYVGLYEASGRRRMLKSGVRLHEALMLCRPTEGCRPEDTVAYE